MIPVSVAFCAFGILGRNAIEGFRFIKGLNNVIQGEITTSDFLSEWGQTYVKSTLVALGTCSPVLISNFPEKLLNRLGLTRDDLYKAAETGEIKNTDNTPIGVKSDNETSDALKLGVLGILLYNII